MGFNAALVEEMLSHKVSKWSKNPRFTIAYKDSILNEAQQLFMEICANYAQTNDRVEEDIRVLKIDEESLVKIADKETSTIFKLPDNYFRLIRLGGKIKCPECPEKKLRKLILVKGHEESNMLINRNWNPSWEFSSTFFSLVHSGFKVYHDKKFDITQIWSDYYRKPTEFRTASKTPENRYQLNDGNIIDYDQISELVQNYQLRRITDIAAVICERDFDNLAQWDLRIKAITLLENLYK